MRRDFSWCLARVLPAVDEESFVLIQQADASFEQGPRKLVGWSPGCPISKEFRISASLGLGRSTPSLGSVNHVAGGDTNGMPGRVRLLAFADKQVKAFSLIPNYRADVCSELSITDRSGKTACKSVAFKAIQVKNNRGIACSLATGSLCDKCSVSLERLGSGMELQQNTLCEATASLASTTSLTCWSRPHRALVPRGTPYGNGDRGSGRRTSCGPAIPSKSIIKGIGRQRERSRPARGSGSRKSVQQRHPFRCRPYKFRDRKEEENPKPKGGAIQTLAASVAVLPQGISGAVLSDNSSTLRKRTKHCGSKHARWRPLDFAVSGLPASPALAQNA